MTITLPDESVLNNLTKSLAQILGSSRLETIENRRPKLTKKNKIPDKYQIWIDVRKRYHLSDVHIQMARELGMNPKKFGKIANEKQEPWKAPLPAFIEHIYLKRFGRDRPADVKSIEEVLRAKEKKKEERRKGEQQKRSEVDSPRSRPC